MRLETNKHDNVELPEPVKVVELRVHAVLFVVKPTRLANPFWPVSVTVEFPAAPTLMSIGFGLEVRLKSTTVMSMVTGWTTSPLVPRIVIV